jgi:hypothetical protein
MCIGGNIDKVQERVKIIKENIAICSVKDDADVVVFVSKMMPVRVADLSKRYIYMGICILMYVCICE